MSDTPETDHLEVQLGKAATHSHPILWEHSRRMERERNEARKELDEEMKFHHRTHAELVQTQCKLLDMEMKCDQLQDEIKLLKEILNLIKKDVS
jgi:hypothetical protein